MTALVTKHLPLVAGAPDGIKRLRGLILELAVRGRLVDQDPSDEPAVELLKRITEGKSRFDASRSKRSYAERSQPSLSTPPYQAPAGWTWTTFGASTICRDGERVPVSQVDREVRAKVYDYYGASGVIDKIDNYLFDKPLLLIGEDGANLINRATPIAFIARGQYWVNNHAHVIDGVSDAFLEYMALYINAIDLKPFVTGTAQPKMNQAKLNSIPVPLPPELEQKRIVAKVDELMALCDRLEADQADADAAHAQLVQALLGSVTQAADAADFRASWQRLSEHFHTLFTTEASIDALKQTVLQLAVMGKLVQQMPSEESALLLLARIRAEKMQLAKAGLVSKPKPTSSVDAAEQSFPLPNGWAWTRFQDFALDVATGPFGSLIHQSDYVFNGVPLVNPSHMVNGRIEADVNVSLPKEMADQLSSYKLRVGDIVMARRGEVGRVALVTVDEAGWLCGTGSFVLRFHPDVSRPYVRSLFTCSSTRRYLAGAAVGTTMVNLNHGILLNLPVAIPPAEEQRRIVAKVDELMALCDQLKAQLQQGRQQHAQLASVLVEQAVA